MNCNYFVALQLQLGKCCYGYFFLMNEAVRLTLILTQSVTKYALKGIPITPLLTGLSVCRYRLLSCNFYGGTFPINRLVLIATNDFLRYQYLFVNEKQTSHAPVELS